MTQTLRRSGVVRSLVAQYAYTRRPEAFTLSSGVTSYDYIDAKQILLVNEFQAAIGAEIARAIEDYGVRYAAVGGLELGAIYVAQALLLHEWLETKTRSASFVVRKRAKKHGKGLRIEGPSVTGQEVIVVDDVVTTGDSIIKAVEAVQNEGATVALAVTLVDRGDWASERLAELEVPYHPLTTYRDYGIQPIPKGDASVGAELNELRGLTLERTDRIPDLIAWCWDESDNTGDARFSGVARTLEVILREWDVKGGLPESVVTETNAVLHRHLEDVIGAPDSASGSNEARWMREEITRVLDGATDHP
jgi:orotate phosphoribosyltransferase